MGKYLIKITGLNSNGNCFLCSGHTSSLFTIDSPEKPCSQNALSRLVHHLKINRRELVQLLKPNKPVQKPSLLKNKTTNFDIRLCQECSRLLQKFSELHLQFEKIEMEITSCLRLIHGKLISSDEGPSRGRMSGTIDIMTVLKKEIISKCSQRLNNILPRVKIRKLANLKGDRRVYSHLYSDDPVIDIGLVKVEHDSKLTPLVNTVHDPNVEGGCEREDDWTNTDSRNIEYEEKPQICHKYTAPIQSHPEIEIGEVKVERHYDSAPAMSDDDIHNDKPAAFSFIKGQKVKKAETSAGLEDEKSELYTVIGSGSQTVSRDPQFTCNSVTGKFICSICLKEYGYRNALRKHHNASHRKLRYRCNVCSKDFYRRSSFNNHYKSTHVGVRVRVKRPQCQKCKKAFVTNSSLARHLTLARCDIPKPPKNHLCKLCGKRYLNKEYLQAHHKTVHQHSMEFACSQCDKVFVTSYSLQTHVNGVHLGVREHGCHICGVKFKLKAHLQNHQRCVHSGLVIVIEEKKN